MLVAVNVKIYYIYNVYFWTEGIDSQILKSVQQDFRGKDIQQPNNLSIWVEFNIREHKTH